MRGFDLLVRGGTLVTGGSMQRADIGVTGGRIAATGDLSGSSAARVVDATDCLVLPGLVDPHTHMNGAEKSFPTAAEGLRATSRAALCGGTTTILAFVPATPEDIPAVVDETVATYGGSMATDFGLHISLHTAPPEDGQLARAVEAGITSFHTSFVGGHGRKPIDEPTLLELYERTAAVGGMVIFHAENPGLNEYAVARLRARGEPGLALAGECHPWYAEGDAARRAAFLAEVAGGNLYIEHLSTEPALDAVRRARQNGQAVFAETCPHYLAFNQEMYATPRGVEFLKSPPLRRPEDQAALWEGVLDGSIQSIGTDESTALRPQKEALLERRPVYEVSGGLNAIEVRLPVIYTELVVRRNASPTRVVQLLASNPARIFGLYPRKGSLSPGADADLLVVDPTVERAIRNAELHQGTDHTIFEGWVTRGWPRTVVFGGEVVAEGGEPVGESTGRYLKRGPSVTQWTEELVGAGGGVGA
jgi:dihydropyrimidinase